MIFMKIDDQIENPFDLKVQISLNQIDEFSFFVMVLHIPACLRVWGSVLTVGVACSEWTGISLDRRRR